MFARTPRLLLRPGFPEDAPALATEIADEAIVKNLATAPWPFRMRDAARERGAGRESTDQHPRLPGEMRVRGLQQSHRGPVSIGSGRA